MAWTANLGGVPILRQSPIVLPDVIGDKLTSVYSQRVSFELAINGQFKAYDRPAVRAVCGPDTAAVGLDNAAGNGQP